MATKIPFSNYAASSTKHRSIDEAASEVAREVDVRRRLYDKWVGEGRLTWVDAHDRLERLLAALQFLTGRRAMSVDAPVATDFDDVRAAADCQGTSAVPQIPVASSSQMPVS